MNAPTPTTPTPHAVQSSEGRAAVDLGAAVDRFVRRGPELRECDVEALRAELVQAMARMCDEFGLVDQAEALMDAAVTEFGREEEQAG